MTGRDALVRLVQESERLFVLTGAGCSTDSKIPDYRDANGAWKRPPPVQYLDFVKQESARRRYWSRSLVGWPVMAAAEPNPAHRALARLERAGHIHLLVTQNVDGLHQKAGSREVLDLHGRLDGVVCLACNARSARTAYQVRLEDANPAWQDLDATVAPDGDADLLAPDLGTFDVPPCAACGGVLKPDVVFFGETVPKERVERAYQGLAQADAVLVVGSSLMVFSGFRFVKTAAAQDLPIALVNRGTTRADELATVKIALPCGGVLSALAQQLA